MPVVWTQQSAYAQERRRHEALHSEFGAPGRPYEYREYPTQMYKATRQPDGTRTLEGERAENETERERLERLGYVWGGRQAAVEALERQELEFAKLAAERNHEVRTMSEGARTEVAEYEATHGITHHPTIPETPVPAHSKAKNRPSQ